MSKRKKKSGVVILGLDPGFANLGVMVLHFTAQGSMRVLHTEVITTKGATKKRRAREMDDELRRLEELRLRLRALVKEYQPDAIASEQRPQLRSQKSSALVALAFSMTFTLARENGLPFLAYTISEIKQEVCCDKQASKADIVARLKHLDPRYKKWPEGGEDHCADAGGAAMCGARDPVIEILLRERA